MNHRTHLALQGHVRTHGSQDPSHRSGVSHCEAMGNISTLAAGLWRSMETKSFSGESSANCGCVVSQVTM